METLKIVTETTITTTTTTTVEEKYKVVAPEAMQETFMSDSEDEGGKILFATAIPAGSRNEIATENTNFGAKATNFRV